MAAMIVDNVFMFYFICFYCTYLITILKGGCILVSVNELGLDLFEELVENADLFNVAYHELDNGARIVDCGVSVPGGFGAGDYFTRICMGGLGDIAFRQRRCHSE